MKHLLVLLIAVLPIRSLIATPPDLPEHVQAYLDVTALDYELPRGRFESYLKSYFDEQNLAEPWAIVGDFNGDTVSDWAGLLRHESGQLNLVVVYSESSKYVHMVLSSLGVDEDGIYTGVELEPPGEVHGFPIDDEPNPVVTLSNPGIHLFYYEKSSVLYYWDEGSFSEMWTSD